MSSGEKTEDPTPRALRKARERGEVARSNDLTAFLVLLVGLGTLVALMGDLGTQFRLMIERVASMTLSGDHGPAAMLTAFAEMAEGVGVALLPLLALLAAAAFAAVFLQVGPLLTLTPLLPKFERMDAVKGVKRMFFSSSTWVELAKATAKLLVVGIVAGAVVWQSLSVVLRTPLLEANTMVQLGFGVITETVKFILVAYLGIAVFDFVWQRYKFQKDHRMTKQEVKEEYKSQEGDPQHKSARKRLHEEISTGMSVAQTEKADVIVTNPTHIACALRYDPEQDGSPRLLAKGAGHVAEQIREIARQMDIPIVRDVGLARAMHELEVDTEIPEELFDAAAEVLKWVETLAAAEGRVPTWLKSSQEQPPPASY